MSVTKRYAAVRLAAVNTGTPLRATVWREFASAI
jgi:hypothetical protein